MPASRRDRRYAGVREGVDGSGRETARRADDAGAPDDRRAGVGAIILVALVQAACFALAFPPYGLWPLIFAVPAGLALIAVMARSTRAALLVVGVIQLVTWTLMQRWLANVTVLGLPAFAVYLSLYALAFVWIVRRASMHARCRHWPMTVLVPVVWVGLEGLRGELFMDGYGWFLLAHPLTGWLPLVQSADLLGTYLLSFLVAATAGGFLDAARWWRQGRRRRVVVVAAVLAAIHGVNVGYGIWQMGRTTPHRDGPRILAVQTDLPQSNKIAWSLEQKTRDVASFIDLTRRAFEAAGGGVDLVVWPETMLPVHGLEAETLRTLRAWGQLAEASFADAAIALAEELGTPMLVGAPAFVDLDVDPAGSRWTWSRHYNSAYLISGDHPYPRYDKILLTPFGEVMPYISSWPWLEAKLLALGASGMSFTLDAAEAPRRIPLPWNERVLDLATPICFEDAVPRVCRRLVHEAGRKRAAVIVNLSNDGWFGDADATRAQHVQVARFRCIENRTPMVRCVNTGFTVSIDSSGRVVGTVGSGMYGEPRRAGWLETTVTLDDRHTLYGRIGEIGTWTCLVAGVVFAGWMAVDRRKGSTS